MAGKKLTKTNKEILQVLRDYPDARIEYLDFSVKYRLIVPSRGFTRSIRNNDTFYFLKTWLKEVDKKKGNYNRYYTIREDAEISDAWYRDEIARQGLEALNRRAEELRQRNTEAEQSADRLWGVWKALERGEVINLQPGPYTFFFEFEGRQYRLEEGDEV